MMQMIHESCVSCLGILRYRTVIPERKLLPSICRSKCLSQRHEQAKGLNLPLPCVAQFSNHHHLHTVSSLLKLLLQEQIGMPNSCFLLF